MIQQHIQFFKFSNMLKFPLINYSTSLIVMFLFLAPMACVDLEYDAPPPGGLDPNLPVNLTIAELKERHVPGQYERITDDVIIAGLVISNDEAGNFFKQLVIADETGGIEMRIEMTDMHNVYPVGRKVYMKAKGLWLGDYNDLIQLGAGHDAVEDELIRIPESLVDQYIVPATYGNPVIPKTLTIDQLTLSDVSTLVKLEGVQFVSADAGETWADAVLQETLNREIEDCPKQRLIIRSSGFARFAGDLTPEGNGTMIGILSVYRGDYQLMIRDLDDVMMTGDRCGSNALTIAAVRNLFSGGTTTLPQGFLKGVVISDRSSENLSGLGLYLQDATGGIVIRFTDDHDFNLGDEIIVDVSGETLSEFNGLLQISGLDLNAANVEGHPGDVTPRVATISEVLNNAQAWESTLVRINDVILGNGSVYRDTITVTDATGVMILFTRSQATFAASAIPTGPVTITAIVSEFNAPQLIIRNTADVSGGSSGSEEIDESFNSVADNDDVLLPGWSNIAVKGTRLWRAKVFMGNHYAQATAFGDTEIEMESWLITPAIELDVAKKLSFESAYAFFTHDGLTVWISSNFNGSNVTGATWTQLNPVIAQSTDTEHAFIPSGDIDLSAFSGPVRIGFKYVGSGPGGQTTSFRVDNVKVEKL